MPDSNQMFGKSSGDTPDFFIFVRRKNRISKNFRLQVFDRFGLDTTRLFLEKLVNMSECDTNLVPSLAQELMCRIS